jgi:head-tail adaptor
MDNRSSVPRDFKRSSAKAFHMRSTLLVLLALGVPPLLAEEPANDTLSAAESRLASIAAEIDCLGQHEWAGAYSDGAEGGFTGPLLLWIAPETGAGSTQRHCMGEDANFGTITKRDSILNIDWDKPSRTGLSPTERELLVVPFREYTYLVPKNGIHPFCIAARTHGRQTTGVLRSLELRKQPHSDEPQVPGEFQKYVNMPSVKADVIAIEKQERAKVAPDEEQVTQRIVLDVGTNDHVFAGMRFEENRADPPRHVVTIVDVESNQSTAESRYYAAPRERIRPIRKGWVFHTASW